MKICWRAGIWMVVLMLPAIVIICRRYISTIKFRIWCVCSGSCMRLVRRAQWVSEKHSKRNVPIGADRGEHVFFLSLFQRHRAKTMSQRKSANFCTFCCHRRNARMKWFFEPWNLWNLVCAILWEGNLNKFPNQKVDGGYLIVCQVSRDWVHANFTTSNEYGFLANESILLSSSLAAMKCISLKALLMES